MAALKGRAHDVNVSNALEGVVHTTLGDEVIDCLLCIVDGNGKTQPYAAAVGG